MTTINYQLVDAFENYKEFDNVADAVKWMQGIGKDKFQYVSLTDGKLNAVDGFDTIVKAYNNNNDLWHGDADCIHLNTHSGIGGGCHCDTCSAWFCY